MLGNPGWMGIGWGAGAVSVCWGYGWVSGAPIPPAAPRGRLRRRPSPRALKFDLRPASAPARAAAPCCFPPDTVFKCAERGAGAGSPRQRKTVTEKERKREREKEREREREKKTKRNDAGE